MKQGGIILLIVLLFSTARAQYEVLYIDPGHGGPTASQTVNGDGAGAVGQAGTAEQWVNLQVSLALKEILINNGCVEGIDFWLSRTTDTISIIKTPRYRTEEANSLASETIGIHHNGLVAGAAPLWCFFLLSTVLASSVRKMLERGVCQTIMMRLDRYWLTK